MVGNEHGTHDKTDGIESQQESDLIPDEFGVKNRAEIGGIHAVEQHTGQQKVEGDGADMLEGRFRDFVAAADQGAGADDNKDRQDAVKGDE